MVGAIMILVFVHEMGHFLAAKWFGMRIDTFSVGFPPNIVNKKFGETEYVLGATPLGGYVKIAGMVDESLDDGFAGTEPEPWEFRSKPVWQRAIVMCAGVAFNVLLAAAAFSSLKFIYGSMRPLVHEDGSVFVEEGSVAATTFGLKTGDRILSIGGEVFEPGETGSSPIPLLADPLTIEVDRSGERLSLEGPDDILTRVQEGGGGGLLGLGVYNQPSVVGDVAPGRPAAEAGLQLGDRIVSIAGQEVLFWEELTSLIQTSGGRPLPFVWEREGTTYRADIEANEDDDGVWRIGIGLPGERQSYSLAEAIAAGTQETWDNTRAIVVNLKRIVTGQEDVRKSLGGPVMVARITGQAAQAGGRPFWTIVALLSLTLAIVNILPIPALDGGHLVFLIYEGIARREPSLKVRMVTQQAGMLLLLMLMVLLILNDFAQIF